MKRMLLAPLLWSLIMSLPANEEAVLTPASLADALWRGVLHVQVKGPMYTQYLANIVNDNGTIKGFVKEKGEMNTTYQLQIEFLINSLGEYTMVAAEELEADYLLTREKRTAEKEEKYLERTRVKYLQDVQHSESTITRIHFDSQEQHQGVLAFGSLRFLPSGRMDRKGEIEVMGDFKVPLKGEGSIKTTRERQPPSGDSEKDRTGTVADISKTVLLPLSFNFQIQHKKEAVEGGFQIAVEPADPFPITEGDKRGRRRFNNRIVASGTYRLTPLFSSKKGR